MSSTIANIYIPSIHVSWDRRQITEVFSKLGIGNVQRIDFVRNVAKFPKNDIRTINEHSNKQFRQALIRIDVGDNYDSPFVEMPTNMHIRLYPLTSVSKTRELHNNNTNVDNRECWICMGAYPLIDTNFNINEIIKNLHNLFPRLKTDDDKRGYNYILKHACLLRDKNPSYQNVSERNIHQLDDYTKKLEKSICMRENAEGVQAEGVQADSVQADSVQADGVQAEGVQAESVQAEIIM